MSRFLRFETGICDLNDFCGFSAEEGYYSRWIRRSNRNQYIAFNFPWLWLLGVGQQSSPAVEGYGFAAIMLSVCKSFREERKEDETRHYKISKFLYGVVASLERIRNRADESS